MLPPVSHVIILLPFCAEGGVVSFFPKDNVLECPGEPQGSCGICVGCCINTTFEAVLV